MACRAVQNMMYEGKERRLELIRELRVSEEASAQDLLDEQEAEAEAGLSSVVGQEANEKKGPFMAMELS